MIRRFTFVGFLVAVVLAGSRLGFGAETFHVGGIRSGVRWEGQFHTDGQVVWGQITLPGQAEQKPLAALGTIDGDVLHVRVFSEGVQLFDFVGVTDGEFATGSVRAGTNRSLTSDSERYSDLALDRRASTDCDPAEDVCGPAPAK